MTNTQTIAAIINDMISYYASDAKRINHFLKVYSFAKTIGELEGLDPNTQYVLEVTAVVHDIGIKISEEKYHSSAGNYQELEGPTVARKLLSKFSFSTEDMERICYLIGHHHTYNSIDGIDYQILIEADFLVNAYEDDLPKEAIETFSKHYFKTSAGITFLTNLYLSK